MRAELEPLRRLVRERFTRLAIGPSVKIFTLDCCEIAGELILRETARITVPVSHSLSLSRTYARYTLTLLMPQYILRILHQARVRRESSPIV